VAVTISGKKSIPQFFDPVNFEEVCDRFSVIIRDYLNQAVDGRDVMKVLSRKSPDDLLVEWGEDFPEKGIGFEKGVALVEKVIAESIHLHHPRYMGHQVTSPLPMTILCDMIILIQITNFQSIILYSHKVIPTFMQTM
jgi:L-2,4-diaminobutyrate decarboxylase